jgi:hypothetical protein
MLHGSSNPLETDGGPMSVVIASDSTVFTFNFAASSVTEIDMDGNLLRRFLVGDGAQTGAVRYIGGQPCEYARGDANSSEFIDIDDVVWLIAYVFSYGQEPACDGTSGDVDCSGAVDVDDIVYLIYYVFGLGPEPCPY